MRFFALIGEIIAIIPAPLWLITAGCFQFTSSANGRLIQNAELGANLGLMYYRQKGPDKR
jgi:hypothetical protein